MSFTLSFQREYSRNTSQDPVARWSQGLLLSVFVTSLSQDLALFQAHREFSISLNKKNEQTGENKLRVENRKAEMEKVTLSIKNFVKGVNEWIKKKKTQWHKDGYWLNQENPPPKKIKLSDKIVLMMQKDPTKSVSKIHCLSKVIARKMFHLANKWSLSSLMPSLSFLAIFFLFLLTSLSGSSLTLSEWMPSELCRFGFACWMHFSEISYCCGYGFTWIVWLWMQLRWETKQKNSTQKLTKGSFSVSAAILRS